MLFRSLRFGADIVGNPHRTEFRPAHRAEMRHLMRLLGQGLVMHGPRRVGIEREVELILPAELEPRAAQRIVAPLRPRQPLGQVGGMGL